MTVSCLRALWSQTLQAKSKILVLPIPDSWPQLCKLRNLCVLQFPHPLKEDVIILPHRARVRAKLPNTFIILVVNTFFKMKQTQLSQVQSIIKIAFFFSRRTTFWVSFLSQSIKQRLHMCVNFIDNSLSYTKCEFSELGDNSRDQQNTSDLFHSGVLSSVNFLRAGFQWSLTSDLQGVAGHSFHWNRSQRNDSSICDIGRPHLPSLVIFATSSSC